MLAALVPALLVIGALIAVSCLLAAASEVSRILGTRRHSAEGIAAIERMLEEREAAAAGAAGAAKPHEPGD